MSVFVLVFALFGVLRATNLFDCNPRDFYGGFDPSDYSNPYELKKAVHDLIDGHVIIPYGDCDEAMEILDANPNGVGVIGIYSLLPKHPFPDTWNREHVWPRSRGVGDSGADTSDLFHLFPTDMNLNSARGNKYFDECTPGSNGCESPAGTSSEDAAPGTSENSNVWAPPPSMRGDLARAVFYMAVRYDGSDSSTTNLKIKECSSEGSCGSNTFGRLSTLLKWHREDPVSSAELARIDGICSGYQGNRNPFVDFPELADRLESVFADDGFEVEYEVHVPSVLFMSTGGSLIILSAFFLVAYIAGYRVHRVQDKKEAGVVGEVMASSL